MQTETTLARVIVCAGSGVHSGLAARLTIHPAPAGSGIRFRRADLALPPDERTIPARFDAVSSVLLSTSLANSHGVQVTTVEHLMAALYGCGVDNALIELSGEEVPIMDGSAAPFCAEIAKAGLKNLARPRKLLRILHPVIVEEDDRRAAFLPADDARDSLTMDIMIDFADPAIGRQSIRLAAESEVFVREIAPARTFGFMRDLAGLRAAGKGLGASLDNTIAIEEGRILNQDGLRFADEFVRHKALDALGDAALAGSRIAGVLVSEKGGHALNNRLLHELFAAPDAWRMEDAQ